MPRLPHSQPSRVQYQETHEDAREASRTDHVISPLIGVPDGLPQVAARGHPGSGQQVPSPLVKARPALSYGTRATKSEYQPERSRAPTCFLVVIFRIEIDL